MGSMEEKVNISDEGLEALLETSEGDLRKAITTLQSSSRLSGDENSEDLTRANVEEITGVIPDSWLNKFIKVARSNSYEKLEVFIDELMYEGYSAHQLINQLHDLIVGDEKEKLSDRQKSVICETLAINESRLLEGASEALQLLDIGVVLMKELAAQK